LPTFFTDLNTLLRSQIKHDENEDDVLLFKQQKNIKYDEIQSTRKSPMNLGGSFSFSAGNYPQICPPNCRKHYTKPLRNSQFFENKTPLGKSIVRRLFVPQFRSAIQQRNATNIQK
jgi:hypothetical protein